METRSRKRAEASSAAPHSSSPRPSKRPRSSITPTVTTRSRTRDHIAPPTSPSAAAQMDSEPSGTRRRNSGKSQQPPPPPDREPDLPASKGKEREAPEASSRSRDRERDAERILGLSFDGGGGADDDGEGAVGILHQNLTSASTALQGLLRKLGAGLDDLLPSSGISGSSSSHQSGKLKKILSGLRADGEEGKQVEALTQLCEMLSIGTEESLGSFSVDSFVPVLVGLLNHESNPDIMLLAARALTHLCDVLPNSCGSVVHYGAVPCFCARLLTIEYMDLAEQSLQALKKISQEHPTPCLRAGALMAVLSYLDFFSTGVQRVALSTAANMCKKLPSDAADFVMEAIPLLTNLLRYHDLKVLDHACVCLTRIAESFASSPEKLDELCNHGLVSQAASLVSISTTGGQGSLSTSTYTGLLRLLSTCASGSPLAAKTLLLLGISGILKDVLSGSGLVSNISVSSTLTRPSEQIYEIVNLADELLPLLPHGTISLPVYTNILIKGSASKRTPSSGGSGRPEEANEAKNDILAREKLLHEQPELLKQFGVDLLPVLIQVYGASVSGPVRHKCLWVIGKLMHFSNADMIQDFLGITNLSSFLAGALAWKDPQVLIPAVQIAEILMEKLPETFYKMFIREGVVHAVDALICSDSSSLVSPQASLNEKDNDSLSGTSRSRRYKRRSGPSNVDNNTLEDPKSSGLATVGSPPPPEFLSSNSNLRVVVSVYAKSFKEKYFHADPGADGVTDDLRKLKDLCSKLNGIIDDVKIKSKGKSKAGLRPFEVIPEIEENVIGVISEILSELSKGDGVSTFEFIGSGAVLALLNYLSCGTFGKERILETNLPKLRQLALRRYKSFISLSLPVDMKQGTEVPLVMLVKKLQDSLSSLERFPVVLSHSARSSNGSARLSSGLSVLSQPFKLRLCRAQGEKSLRDYSSNVVLIDPLASLAAVEEFLWPRIQRSDLGQRTSAGNSDNGAAANLGSGSSPSTSTPSSRRPSTRSRSSVTIGNAPDPQEGNATNSKGKGKAILKSTPDEADRPQTRNAARWKAAADKEANTKLVHGDSSSEGDELEVSPAELDEALVIEEDDLSEDEDDDHEEVLRDDALPAWVHDVKLGDSADDANMVTSSKDNLPQASSGSSNRCPTVKGVETPDLRNSGGFGSRSTMSFAAAAMAGLASVSGRGIRSGRYRHSLLLGTNLNDHCNKLIFTACGKQLSKHLTIYQAIQRQLVLEEDDDDRYNGSDLLPSDSNRLWSDIYTITYQKADTLTERASGVSNSHGAKNLKSGSAASSSDMRWQPVSLLDSILQGELPCELERSNNTYNILALLRVLEGLNQLTPILRVQAVLDDFAQGKLSNLDGLYIPSVKVSLEEFVNNKLTPKLARQILDPLALCSGSLPPWCYQMTKACPFLFPFETRKQYFFSTAFGLSRALHRLQQQNGAENHSSEREVRVGRLQRQKVRVSRNRILDSAIKVMEMYSSQKAVLEVEYFGEVGTGLGPTLEFYTLLSHDLQKVGLEIWRSNTEPRDSSMQIVGDEVKSENSENLILEAKKPQHSLRVGCENHIHAPLGLFPRPWPSIADTSDGSQFSKVLEYFRLIGRVMAKALQDGRLLDLPLSIAFYKLVLGQELDLLDILLFDAELGKILQEMQALVRRKQFLESSGAIQMGISNLCFRGAPVEDLFLDFTLPGYPDYVLKEGQENTMVNIDNLEEYINLIVDATVKTGIMRQMEAFKAGFNQVFDISSLQIFTPHELDYLLCGHREQWEPESLAEHIKFDHGYTARSPAIVHLLEIMGEFTQEQQKAFCQFVTGAPRLPPGGLAALNPKLTIVRKHSSSSNTTSNNANVAESVGDDLPSVMTCANYLKLPAYSSKEIMQKKLLYAIFEGRGSFDLS